MRRAKAVVQAHAQASASIAYAVDGEGPAVVLLRPIGVDRTWWTPYVSHLRSRHRVIAIDLPGHGESAQLFAWRFHTQAILMVSPEFVAFPCPRTG